MARKSFWIISSLASTTSPTSTMSCEPDGIVNVSGGWFWSTGCSVTFFVPKSPSWILVILPAVGVVWLPSLQRPMLWPTNGCALPSSDSCCTNNLWLLVSYRISSATPSLSRSILTEWLLTSRLVSKSPVSTVSSLDFKSVRWAGIICVIVLLLSLVSVMKIIFDPSFKSWIAVIVPVALASKCSFSDVAYARSPTLASIEASPLGVRVAIPFWIPLVL